MKNEKMLHAIGRIDDDMIEDAVIQPGQKKQTFVRTPAFRRAVAIAACFVLIIGLTFSVPTWRNPNNDGPGVPVEPGVPVKPGVSVDPGIPLPPSMQENDQGIQINGLDQLSYYAAVRMIECAPKLTNQSITVGNYGITLLASGYDTDKREEPPEPETTGPEETQGPPVTPDPSRPPVIGEDIYYYEMEPDQPFFINKVSMFQIELTDENGFLASKLGLGIVDVAILEDCIWGENMITFRNGDNFYSCLSDGGGVQRKEFSTHKYVEGFYIVKNIAQENYGFYIDLDEAGQAIAFECGERENGGNRVDRNVKIVSSTVISEESSSFTVAELEDYFNTGSLPEGTTPPTQPQDPPKVEQPEYTFDVYSNGEYVFTLDSEGTFIFHHVSGQNVDYRKGTYTMLEGSLELTFLLGDGITETVSCELSQNGFIYKDTEYIKNPSANQLVTGDPGRIIAAL